MKFKLLLSLLIAAMLVCSFAFVASAASEVTEIGTADELAALMADSTAWAGNYKLTADIDLTGKAQNPIGNTSTKFTGTFDGDNHEITGVSITGSEQGTGFFGYISGATIKNLTVGGSVESSKSRAGGIVACVTGVSTIENCTSNVSVVGKGGATGGIVGTYISGKGSKVSVINCVNNGDVIGNGGIVGYIAGSAAFNLEIIGCVNNGNVTGTSDSTGVGGVFGYGAGTAESGDNPILIEKCANYGTVSPDTSSGKYVGGILGRVVNGDKTDYNLKYAFSVTVRNCYNKGDIIGKTGGGIVGYVRPPKADTGTCVFENVMSADSTNRAIIGAVGSGSSTTRVTYTFTNAYTVGGTTIMQSTSPAYYTFAKTNVCLADATEAELAALSEAEGWVMGENGPELMSFHTHTSVVVAVEGGHRTECGICGDESTFGTVEEHISVDGVCTVCGAITACAHESTTEQLVNASTCITKGSVNVVCNVCGATVETVELDIDSANHGGEQTYEWTVNAESGAYEIICAGCGVAMHTSTSLPTVYLANYGTTVGDDANDGLTPETAVASITEAVNRIKNMGGTVKIVFGYALTAADVVLPEWNGTITFTSNEFDEYGAAIAGFNVEKHGARLTLGGDAKFDAILVKGKSSSVYRVTFVLNWHNADFGYIIAQNYATAYIIAGKRATTKDDADVKTTNITIEGPARSTKARPYFYEIIYLGSTYGADGIDVSNKTVILDVNDGYDNTSATTRTVPAIINALYTMSTSASYPLSRASNCTTEVTVRGTSGVSTFRTGNKNVSNDEIVDDNGEVTQVASAAHLDNLTINFLDNSQIMNYDADKDSGTAANSGSFQLENVKNLTVNVSTEAGGRTVPLYHSIFLYKYGTFVNEDATVTLNAGTHSFIPTITDFVKEAARKDGLYPYSVVENIVDECVFGEGELTTEPTPEQDGVMTYTCECGRTKTEIISISCPAHEYIAKADGTYACANGCKNLPAPTAPVIVAATPAVATDGTVTVTVAVKATTPIVAAEFEVNAPAGFTLVSADLLLSPADEDSFNWTATPQDDVTVPYNVVLVNMAIEDSTLDEAVIALTFATDETVENGTIITVNGKEAYNLNEDMFEILSVSAEITVANKLDALYGISATLANELLLEYLVKLGSDVNVENGYITVAHYAEGTSIPTVEIVSEYTVNSAGEYNVYRFYAPGVAAKEMSDRIVVTFHATVDGKSYAAASYEKNIVDYYNMAYAAYGEATTGQAPAFMNVLNALLNYGAEAQRYFGYNEGNFANSVLPADKQKITFDAEASATTSVENDVENDVYVQKGFYPILEERVVMAISFNITGDAVSDLVFKGSYTDVNGGERVVTVSGDKIKASESGVVVYVDSVAAKDLRQMITGALYSGETQVSDSISFSFECYASRAEEAEKNICNAILNYCDAAKALFAKSTVSE